MVLQEKMFKDALEEGRKVGLEQGEAKGLVKGEKHGAKKRDIEIAKAMLKNGKPVAEIRKYTGPTKKVIEELQGELSLNQKE